MIIISSRNDFNDPDKLKPQGHAFKEINFENDEPIRDLSEEQFLEEISGKKILLLVHGYNNEQDIVYNAYSIIQNKISKLLKSKYDLVIGYSWPGGDMGLEWYASKKRANSVARRFRFLLSAMSKNTSALDVMSHSLGARVVFKALKQAPSNILIRNYFCMAAAVDNEVLEKDEEFHSSIKRVGKIFVFHTKKDVVLASAYRIAEWDNALGLYGPEDKFYIQNRTKNIFVVNCKKVVRKHGGYKKCNTIYQYIDKFIYKKPTKFITL